MPHTLDEAIQWHHIDKRLEAAEVEIKGYTTTLIRTTALVEQWWPVVNKCVAQLEDATRRQATFEGGIEQFLKSELPSLRAALDGVSSSLNEVGERMTSLEKSVEHVGKQQTSQAEKHDDLVARVEVLEATHREKQVIATERRRWFSTAHAAIAACAAAAGYLASLIF